MASVASELVASDIDVRYGKAKAVTGVSVTATSRKITAILGPNGAGKSSLLLAIYGSIDSGGKVVLNGKDFTRLSALDRARGGLMIVPQGRQLFPRLSVRENLVIIAQLLKLPADAVDKALDRFPILRERASALAGVLSGGEQQMLAVTRALMTRPRALLLDEMMTGLAPLIVDRLIETLEALLEEGIAIIVAEPEIGPLARVTGRGYIMVRGQVVQALEEGGEALVDAYRAAIGLHS